MSILMVAEKPLLADSIAKYLAVGSIKTRKGVSPVCPVHEFSVFFKGEKKRAKMTSVAGHVFTCDFETKYRSWTVDPSELFHCDIVKEEANPKTRIVQHLKNEAKGCTGLVLWLDCDREGENICFEVMESTVDFMTKTAKIYRAIFSSITEKDIKYAFNHLGNPDSYQAQAVDARQEIDLRVGVAFTRFQTLHLKQKFARLGDSLISYGPCQTPTLGFCVERQHQIDNFVSTPFYEINVVVTDDDGRNKVFKHDKRFDTKQKVDSIINLCKSTKGIVSNVVVGEYSRKRPGGLNTVEMLKSASIRLGLGPHDTMSIAEKLYTRGYISYPRTESTKYSSNFNFRDILDSLSSSNELSQKVQIIFQNGINVPKSGSDKGDHPPITPLKYPTEYLSDQEKRLFNFITNHFLASIFKDATYQKVSVTLQFDDYKFTASSKTPKDPGFLKITSKFDFIEEEDEDYDYDTETILPNSFVKGEIVDSPRFNTKKGMTSCPNPLTESELIALMEKWNWNRCKYSYSSNRSLKPTKLGLALAKTYETIEKKLISPQIRSHIEQMVSQIAIGRESIEVVIGDALDLFESYFLTFRKNFKIMEDNFEGLYHIQDQQRLFSKCGKCGRMTLKVISSNTYLLCPQCSEKYELPQNTTYAQYTRCCPLDNYEILLLSSKTSTKKELCCPCCYNNGNQFMTEKGTCLSCMNPNCKMSCESTRTLLCSVCGGYMCLSPLQNKWSCFCSQCDSHIEWNGDVKRVSIAPTKCSKCSYNTVDIVLKTGASIKGCMGCDIQIKKLYETKAVFPSSRGSYRGGSRGGSKRGGNRGGSRGKHRGSRGGHYKPRGK
ncbi:DNA topoisomerase [Entamoeba marina]